MRTAIAHATEYAEYEGSAHKLLSDNRKLYIIQSQNTVAGRAAPFPSPSDVPSDPLPVLSDGLSSSNDEKE